MLHLRWRLLLATFVCSLLLVWMSFPMGGDVPQVLLWRTRVQRRAHIVTALTLLLATQCHMFVHNRCLCLLGDTTCGQNTVKDRVKMHFLVVFEFLSTSCPSETSRQPLPELWEELLLALLKKDQRSQLLGRSGNLLCLGGLKLVRPSLAYLLLCSAQGESGSWLKQK